jgi:membrane protease YdiL (CAAX protease family)
LVGPADGDCHKLVNPLNAQLPEEASFRGWAQPKLQSTRTPLAATVLMAIGITIWHVPLFVMPQFGSSPIEALATVAVTFWYAWLFNHAGQRAAYPDRARDQWHHRDQHPVAGRCRRNPDDLALQPGLVLVAIGLLISNRRFWINRRRRSTTAIKLVHGIRQEC